ncbi:cation diffusion facilitator family transporter [Bradyrhizobium genosp. P]|uniref:cation diffusion facilitator family transporter n=1 Tax=Bradyrhizobium genosp. P TaxID=83641 RepID=UPI003CF2402E
MNVTLRQIQAFLAVTELGSFPRAADRLGISQPALSQLVRDLEGMRLIDCTSRRTEVAANAIEFEQAMRGLMTQFTDVMATAVNLASLKWLLSGGGHHDHGHGRSHGPTDAGHDHDDTHPIETAGGDLVLEVFEDGVPPRFRLRSDSGPLPLASAVSIETVRPDGARQLFDLADRGDYLETVDEIPEPHAFSAKLKIGEQAYSIIFEEHEHAHGATARDNNMRAAVIHVIADAAVSVLVIVGLLLARAFGWLWMDPLAGIIGAFVIGSWSFGLIRDTGAILLDMTPDRRMAENLRRSIEDEGDQLADLHLWRLGPGHLGAIVSVITSSQRGEAYYRAKIARFRSLSHLTIEVRQLDPSATGSVV